LYALTCAFQATGSTGIQPFPEAFGADAGLAEAEGFAEVGADGDGPGDDDPGCPADGAT
jgi:hypothetical protein